MEKLNPWQKVPLEVYEGHMAEAGVQQLQALNCLMKNQWRALPSTKKAAVLGIAGGNGLEHCDAEIETVYGIDINTAYLEACCKRFGEAMKGRLKLLQLDLTEPQVQLPKVDLIIADLVIEYTGIEVFCKKAASSLARLISCVIQLPADSDGFVSASAYQSQLQEIGNLHHDVDLLMLRRKFSECGYEETYSEAFQLPNGKCLLRVDYQKMG